MDVNQLREKVISSALQCTDIQALSDALRLLSGNSNGFGGGFNSSHNSANNGFSSPTDPNSGQMSREDFIKKLRGL